MRIKTNKLLFGSYLMTFVLLSIPMLKVSSFRFGQLMILLIFIYLLLQELYKPNPRIVPLVLMVTGGILMMMVSLISDEPKIKQSGFFIKYLFIFPASFYVGYMMTRVLSTAQTVKVLEWSALFFMAMAFLMLLHPIPAIMNDRGGLTGFQGTFMESGWLAKGVTFALVTAMLLRFDLDAWYKNKAYLLLLGFSAVLTLLMTRNKTIWLALGAALAAVALIKLLLRLRTGNMAKVLRNRLSRVRKIKLGGLYVAAGFFVVLLAVLNATAEKAVVSEEILAEKMESERGLALAYGIELLEKSHWFGGYGFGFVESYFSNYATDVIGLGSGSAIMFNVFLDIWISAGIVGLLYHLALLYFSFNRQFLLTTFMPVFLFVVANINPVSGSEFYYLLLGLLCYRASLKIVPQPNRKDLR